MKDTLRKNIKREKKDILLPLCDIVDRTETTRTRDPKAMKPSKHNSPHEPAIHDQSPPFVLPLSRQKMEEQAEKWMPLLFFFIRVRVFCEGRVLFSCVEYRL